jgi:two-component system, cell cycle response regulator
VNILIIEPSRIFQLMLENIVNAYATNVFISGSGTEALNIYKSVTIDLICMSFYLSDMDGIEFVSGVRKLKFGETVPILMITSKKSQETTVKSLNDGVTEIFRKNNLDELKKYLKLFVEHARQQAQIEGSILLIDSDQKQAADIRRFFEDTRLKFIHFTSAEEAEQIARSAEFDLVITNVVLGGNMSGLALIREIREINDTMYRVPILAISAISNVSQKIELFRAGANDYIQKPIILEELSVRMKNLLLSKKLFDTVELQKEQLEMMAIHDQLTGLYNRHYLIDIAERNVNESWRYKFPLSVLVVDLDHFKDVNDTHGHSTGDSVLKAVAGLLLKIFRGSDTAIRFGGEEFVILLPHCNGEEATARADALRLQISALCPNSIPITASIGISQTSPTIQLGFEELFAAADKAVYVAKGNGRNCVVFCDT